MCGGQRLLSGDPLGLSVLLNKPDEVDHHCLLICTFVYLCICTFVYSCKKGLAQIAHKMGVPFFLRWGNL